MCSELINKFFMRLRNVRCGLSTAQGVLMEFRLICNAPRAVSELKYPAPQAGRQELRSTFLSSNRMFAMCYAHNFVYFLLRNKVY